MRLVIPKSRHSKKLEYGMYETWMERPIYIHYIPHKDLHLVNKKYVDEIVSNLDLSKITAIVNRSIFPYVSGDFYKDSGDDQYYLNMTSGTLDGKPAYVSKPNGIILKHLDKVSPDSWPMMSSDFILKSSLPKTLEEWGIKNPIPLDGTGYTNKSFLYKGPKTNQSPVTPSDISNFKLNAEKYSIGDVIMVLEDTLNDVNYIPVDGTVIREVDYPELFSILKTQYPNKVNSSSTSKSITLPSIDYNLHKTYNYKYYIKAK